MISKTNTFLFPGTTKESSEKCKGILPIPDQLNMVEIMSVYVNKKDDVLKQNCLVFDPKEGIVKMVDKETSNKHQSSIMEIIKKLGKGLFSSNSIGASLPCVMFEPRSETDRIAELWRLKSYYFTKAAAIRDKVERIKLVATAEIAQYYLALRKMKSFNPLLGETFQCTISDGSQVAIEQISHHPPITAHYVVGPNRCYVQGGNEEYEGSFKGNCFVFNFHHRCKLTFKDGQEITWLHQPYIKVAGLVFGETHLLLKGCQMMHDRKNKIKVAVFYDFGEKKGLFSSKKTETKDRIEGIIYVPKEGATPSTGNERRISDLADIKTEIARIKGSWFDCISINDVNYWHIDKIMPLNIKLPTNPLPSDCRFREDLIWLRKGNIPHADLWKDALEIRQRQDRKLREQFIKNYKQPILLITPFLILFVLHHLILYIIIERSNNNIISIEEHFIILIQLSQRWRSPLLRSRYGTKMLISFRSLPST
eukprot:TRINITY_DN71638_c0_g1_i1.p1 TRINITY_DN71638_c0_g1~~TRINITY_DN71638_c0_g1_i1.p1  ORF type:complete len:480 (+),score=42.77 TRINITY_DN71638_c0_g1_i1:187-1626(+)